MQLEPIRRASGGVAGQLVPKYTGLIQAFRTIVREEGVLVSPQSRSLATEPWIPPHVVGPLHIIPIDRWNLSTLQKSQNLKLFWEGRWGGVEGLTLTIQNQHQMFSASRLQAMLHRSSRPGGSSHIARRRFTRSKNYIYHLCNGKWGTCRVASPEQFSASFRNWGSITPSPVREPVASQNSYCRQR